jgi:PilZ domain
MEQRVRRRKPVLWSARLHRDGRVLECQTLHISAGGARIRISERFAINSTVVLVIDRVGVFPGEIRRQEDDYAGVSFMDDAQTVEKRLRAALPESMDYRPALQLVPWSGERPGNRAPSLARITVSPGRGPPTRSGVAARPAAWRGRWPWTQS